MEENEVYKDIIGFPNYQISNYGNVKSLNYNRTGEERILKPKKTKNGYLSVHLHKDGKGYNKSIHRLVAQEFIPNDDLFKTEVNHIDENKTNNNINNLEWCTRKYNNNHGTRKEKCSKANRNHPNMSKQVNQFSLDGKTLIKTFTSLSEVERQLGFSPSHISKCCKGKQKTANGFIWKFV